MPLEQQTFWVRWYDAALAIGTTDIDVPLDQGRNILFEGFGGCREDTTVIFQVHIVFTNGGTKQLIPRSSAIGNENWITLPLLASYLTDFREVPMSTWAGCDVSDIRIRVNNSGAGIKYAYGHVRGRYVG